MPKISHKGFTLVELLVVISIITILAVIGAAVYSGVTKGAKDSKRKSDVNAIAKAYEVKFGSSGYSAISDADFSQGKIPAPPEGGSYYNNLVTDNSTYRVCAALEDNPSRTCSSPSPNCYCASSSQRIFSSGSGSGLPPDHPVSCDPNGTLSLGLVGYWKMDEGTGTTAADFSGQGNNGTAHDNNIGNADGNTPPQPVGGTLGNARDFDGVDDYIDAGKDSSLTLGTNPFTLSAWIFLDSIVAGASIFSNVRSGGALMTGFEVTAEGTVRFQGGEGFSTSNETNFTGGTINTGNWYHIAITRELAGGSSQIMKIYLQGNKVAEHDDSLRNMGGEYELYFGEFRNDFRQLDGKLDDARIYNRALSALEITALYNSGNGCIPP